MLMSVPRQGGLINKVCDGLSSCRCFWRSDCLSKSAKSSDFIEEPLSEPICWAGNKKKREDIMADSRISLVSGEKPTLFDVPEDTLAKH